MNQAKKPSRLHAVPSSDRTPKPKHARLPLTPKESAMPTNLDFIFPYRRGQRKQRRGYPADPEMRAKAFEQDPPKGILAAVTKAASRLPKHTEKD